MPVLSPSELREVGLRYRNRLKDPTETAYQPAPLEQERRSAYLARGMARTKATMLATAAVAAGEPTRRDSIEQLAQERIIGSSDLLTIDYLELAIGTGRGVARVDLAGGFGTGFLVGPGLLMTNHHVIRSTEEAMRATAQFDYQENAAKELLPRQDFRLEPNRFFVTSKALDFTVVALAPLSRTERSNSSYPWVKLIAQLGKAETGDPLNIIQHPRGGLKQIAFRNNNIVDIPDRPGQADFLYYTTDTEPGSSGSPCFNDQWELVALHHSGVPDMDDSGRILRTDGQIWVEGRDPAGLIRWVANEGVRVSAIVKALRTNGIPTSWHALRDQMLDAAAPNPIELARAAAPSADPRSGRPQTDGGASVSKGGPIEGSAAMGESYSWMIPVRITVSVGDAPGASAEHTRTVGAERPPGVRAPQEPDLGAEVIIDPDWSSRVGYEADFLGLSIPLPSLTKAQQGNSVEVPPQYRRNGQKYILHYHHYSVAMNKLRRTAWFSAGMIDGERFQSFKRGKDKWFIDPRIDSKFQMGEELYAARNTDRGHLTRFKDASWGDDMDEAVAATNDTFHFTNCTLQLDEFNQGKDRWQGLELYLLEQHAKKDERRMIVFTGPVLGSADPVYRNPAMDYSARIPLAYWKVCCLRRQDGSLSATGFLLGQQDITDLPGFEEAFDVSAVQLTLKELENVTNLGFGTLKSHDHFAAGGDPGTLERAGRPIRPLRTFADIVV